MAFKFAKEYKTWPIVGAKQTDSLATGLADSVADGERNEEAAARDCNLQIFDVLQLPSIFAFFRASSHIIVIVYLLHLYGGFIISWSSFGRGGWAPKTKESHENSAADKPLEGSGRRNSDRVGGQKGGI